MFGDVRSRHLARKHGGQTAGAHDNGRQECGGCAYESASAKAGEHAASITGRLEEPQRAQSEETRVLCQTRSRSDSEATSRRTTLARRDAIPTRVTGSSLSCSPAMESDTSTSLTPAARIRAVAPGTSRP